MDTTAAGESPFFRTEPKTDVEYEVAIGFLVRELERRNEEIAEIRRGGAQVMAEIRANVSRLQSIPPVLFPGKKS